MNRNCWTNSVPYGYGGRSADTSVLTVRIIMSPTCSSRLLVGKKIRSAAALTTNHCLLPQMAKPMACPCPPPGRTMLCSPDLEARRKRCAVACVLTCGIAIGGCGGGERQDANEPEGNFPVEVVSATFPQKQKLAQTSELVITVRNTGKKDVPNVAVTVKGLGFRATQPDLSDPDRPQFALEGVPREIGGFPEAKDATPSGCDSAYVNTWACGSLAPGKETTLVWKV